MTALRASVRLIAFLLFLMVSVILYLLGNLPIAFSRPLRIRWRQFMTKNWARITLRILNIKMTTSGYPPKPPFCLISNHLSYLDAVLFQAQTGCVLVSKSEVANWPFIGILSKLVGTIFIDRNRSQDVLRVNEKLEKAIQEGEGIVFFPEGTTTDGQAVGPFKSSLLHGFAMSAYPVHFAAVSYSTPFADASSALCWWNDVSFVHHFWSVLKIKSSSAFLRFGPTPIVDSDRKNLANELKKKVSMIFTKTHQLST
ncbi:MAG: lysophospholipid acyltransferase family protein [Bacteroidetes bacterium]|nr:lysophospholipid acyltransferase family protein [Bacteroidota bacterium]